MGEIDAAGGMVTGALIGRAVEPKAGDAHGRDHSANCLNCGAALIGPHCHQCGQTGHIHRSLGAVAHEIVHGVLHFEGKFWRTLPLLAWRPGDLTRRYIAGERAKFVSPMAIYLFSIFAMFAVFSFAGISAPTDITGVTAKPAAAIQQAAKDAEENRAEATKELRALAPGDTKRAKYEQRIATANRDLAELTEAAKHVAPDKVDQIANIHTGWHTIDHGIEKWNRNPSLMLYKLQSSSYKFSWLLIPLSLPFVWLLFFWKRQYKLYDHAIFVIYSIAFMSLLFIALTLLGAIGVRWSTLGIVGSLVPLVHITRQLKQAYSLRWRSAILRAIVLTFFIAIILTLFLLILLLLGMF
jgi:hypothetical protein